ncbi:hypothetical protein [Myroides indicus]|uniref:Uncharacterized protein n=1 Tax=Myroides indicus TaxID=1323422 RepID=A0A4R7ETR1_9FLAO|nr:hypothetical protein [Myroides indicus]TDS52413.1 hypothetical protein C8P70_1314 [Myroides indicus]
MYTLSENYKRFIEENKSKNKIINQIELTLLNEDGNKDDIDKIIIHNNQIESVRNEALDYLISYAYFVLSDDFISEEELYDFTALKRIFRIKEGDFIKLKHFEVLEVLKQQFIRMYSDNFIDTKEAITKVNLQIMFDLSYDEFESLKEDEVITSLINGANPKDLDISTLPKGFRI